MSVHCNLACKFGEEEVCAGSNAKREKNGKASKTPPWSRNSRRPLPAASTSSRLGLSRPWAADGPKRTDLVVDIGTMRRVHPYFGLAYSAIEPGRRTRTGRAADKLGEGSRINMPSDITVWFLHLHFIYSILHGDCRHQTNILPSCRRYHRCSCSLGSGAKSRWYCSLL
ncbi:hypothetical protein VTK56DRAFT_7311 [Thermocarpiscus australiensis]